MGSRYEDLLVYKKALDLTCYFETTVQHFDRKHKFAIGARLRNLSMEGLIKIAKANNRKYRLKCVPETIEIFEELKITIHVAHEIQAIKSAKSAKHATECVVNILKQCEGWLKESQNLTAH